MVTLAVLYKLLFKKVIDKAHYLQNLQLYSEYSSDFLFIIRKISKVG